MHFRAERSPSEGILPWDHRRSAPVDLQALLDLCREAAEEIVAHYHDEGRSGLLREKADRSPLTRADVASHNTLRAGLHGLNPDLPLLSEESDEASLAGRRAWQRFWLVDPLDGTREFLERTGQFTINIALIEKQRPILGCIYEPLQQRCYLGLVGEGAWRCAPAGDGWRAEPLHTRPLPSSVLVLLASHRHRNAMLSRTLDYLESRYTLERLNSGSALKFCDLAAGLGDCYPRFSPCSEWDVAAGDALVTAAGGALVGLDGAPLRYNARDTLLSEHFLAVGDPSASLWSELLADLA